MASISSLTGGSSSSIYGTRNVISGLASGLDTEALIENAVSGYKNKITSLQQDRTKIGWQQDAYRSMIEKMTSFTQKYTSYSSSTNLLSSAFFDSSVKVESLGENASKVSASGKTNSTVEVMCIESLASNARYATKGNLNGSGEAAGTFTLGQMESVGLLNGSLTLGYGGKSLQISFDKSDVFVDDPDNDNDGTPDGNGLTAAEKMAAAINKKLEKETVVFDGGSQEKASDRIRAVVNNKDRNLISFELVKEDDGNDVWIKNAGSELASVLNIKIPSESDNYNLNSFVVGLVTEQKSIQDLIEENGFEVTVDGETKKITFDFTPGQDFPKEAFDANGNLKSATLSDGSKFYPERDFIARFNEKLSAAFDGKIKVEDTHNGTGIQLKFSATDEDAGTVFKVSSDAETQLGMEGSLTSYVNTSRKVEDLMARGNWASLWESWRVAPEEATLTDNEDGTFTDSNGNRFMQDQTTKEYYQVNHANEPVYGIRINGEVVATVNKDSTLDDVIKAINSSDKSDVTVAYSEFTGKFTFTAKDGGKNSKIEFDGLTQELFGNHVGDVGLGTLLGYDVKNSGVKGEFLSIQIDGLDFNQDGKVDAGDAVTHTFKLTDPSVDEALRQINIRLKGTGFSVSLDQTTGELKAMKSNGDGTQSAVGISASVSDSATGNAKDLKAALAQKAEADGYTRGQDAVVHVSVNGEKPQRKELKSNTINIDGMTLTLKGTFGDPDDLDSTEAVTFDISMDSDKIVDAVKQMVNDFNTIAKEIKSAYSTMPLQRSNGKYYEPLTEEDQADMSESAIKAYEEKAKTGLLFADRDLSSLYEGLRSALSQLGISGNDATKLGITSAYNDGLTTISLDESVLRSALEQNPDKVKSLFTRSKSGGSSTDGLMQSLKNVMDKYASTTGAIKGILVEKAGSPLAPTSIYQNTIQKQLDNLDKQIQKWQDKISDQIDYYTKRFTALEKLMAQMNNQSGMLMGLSGGY